MLTLAKFGEYIYISSDFLHVIVDFYVHLLYTTKCTIGGIDMNKFEEDVQHKGNDVIDSGKGFVFSFLFFVIIFTIGAVISYLN